MAEFYSILLFDKFEGLAQSVLIQLHKIESLRQPRTINSSDAVFFDADLPQMIVYHNAKILLSIDVINRHKLMNRIRTYGYFI